ncbi:MATE family efflux transporter [Bacillus solimangrovi]|uniref:Probable multidrug resistance protein NorM n=1 Tax=Bacillus solimangrovi TaxID=1305675 RepID=A0A1E5LH06_9BACI|nr:MATE family efflux transporter [Bacillus solimangrovi]OEH93360.1 MATE family efflux transporter [Bacillus solimangrovi]
MYQTETMREKVMLFIKILWPVLVTQISLYAMNLFDTIMSGKAGTDDLAGVAIGSSLWLPVFTGLNGILIAVTPIVAQYVGAGQKDRIRDVVMQAVYLSIVLASFVLILGLFVLEPILNNMELTEEVRYVSKHYLIGLSFGIIPLFIGSVFRNFYDALGYTRITMTIVISAIPVNILFNYALIFGKFGLPELGGIGAGYATAITYWCILGVNLIVIFRFSKVAAYRLFREKVTPSLKAWVEQLKVGVPIGLSIFFEVSIFAAVTLLMSQFSTNTIAAHQAALNFASLIFMFPLSISMALTVAVGYEVGGKRISHAIQYSQIGIIMAVGILLVCSGGLYVFREQIAKLYLEDRQAIELAKQFLIYAIFYQLSDAAQASIQGVLRGFKDVTVPFFMALISYWALGLPTGYFLANYTALEPFGYWVGITVGLTAAAVCFTARLFYLRKKNGLVSVAN